MKLPLLIMALLCLTGNKLVSAQSGPPDSTLVTQARQALSQQYQQTIGMNSRLYNGPEYLNYTKLYAKTEGHQFFLTGEKSPETVQYDGITYHAVPLFYDARLDQVVIGLPTNPLQLRLVSSHVNEFTYKQHRFIRVTPDSVGAKVLSTGFYEVVYAGKVTLLAHRSKRMQEHPKKTGVEVEFTDTDAYFLKQGTTYYPLSTKQSIIKALHDKKRELQQFATTQKLSFQKDSREAAFLQLVQYYSSLQQ